MAYTDHNTQAPRVDLTRNCDMQSAVADISSGTVHDFTIISGAGKFAAQLVRLNNATGAALSAVLVPEQRKNPTTGAAGVVTVTVVVNAGQQYEPPFPVKAIIASGSGALSALACWWFGSMGDSYMNK